MDKAFFIQYWGDLLGLTIAGVVYLLGTTLAARAIVILTMFGCLTYRFFAFDEVSYPHIVLGLLVLPTLVRGWWVAHKWEAKIKAAQRST
jgi:hypothetical protein